METTNDNDNLKNNKEENVSADKKEKKAKVVSLIDYKLKKELREAGFEVRECLKSNKKLIFRFRK